MIVFVRAIINTKDTIITPVLSLKEDKINNSVKRDVALISCKTWSGPDLRNMWVNPHHWRTPKLVQGI